MPTVYVKPTNFCNIDCEHCYLPEETRANKTLMSTDTIRSMAEMTLEVHKKEGTPEICFIFHGGEPLIVSPNWYRKAFSIIDEVLEGYDYYSILQTSLIPYSKKWDELISERFGSCIGTSIDFTQRKVSGNSNDYIDLWMNKVIAARKSGFKVIPGMVPTRHEVNKAKDILNWMIDNKFDQFNIDRFSRYGNEKNIDWPSNKEHATFLIKLFESVFQKKKNGIKVPYINVVAGGIEGVINNNPFDRWGTNCQKEFIVVEPDGSINSCPDRALHEKSFSNINDGYQEFSQSEGRRKWLRIQNFSHKEDHCYTCEYNGFCKSGCPVTPNGKNNGQEECSGYKTYLNYVRDFCDNKDNLKMAMEYIKP